MIFSRCYLFPFSINAAIYISIKVTVLNIRYNLFYKLYTWKGIRKFWRNLLFNWGTFYGNLFPVIHQNSFTFNAFLKSFIGRRLYSCKGTAFGTRTNFRRFKARHYKLQGGNIFKWNHLVIHVPLVICHETLDGVICDDVTVKQLIPQLIHRLNGG